MSALKLYREWEERRRLKWAGWWERKRARGKGQYVRWVTLFWGGAMINFNVLSDYFRGEDFSLVQFAFMAPFYFAGGWLIGTLGWSSNERWYQKYLNAGPGRQLKGGRAEHQLKQ